MGTRDPRFDAYIEKSAPFAQPILEHLRAVVHAACPEVEETMKWSMPHFMYEGMLCGMAAFKAHCTFGFWKGALIFEDQAKSTEAMGHYGCITTLKDLPPKKEIVAQVKRAMALNEQGIKVPKKRKPALVREKVAFPAELTDALALKKHAKARATFEAFSPSHRKEYAEWIGEAKGEETRKRRLTQTLEWLAEGKARNWKYEKRTG